MFRKKSIRKELNMVFFSLTMMAQDQSSSLNSPIIGLLHQSSPWLWSQHYEKQGSKWRCIHRNIFHSRTESDHHSLLVANHWKNGSQAAVSTEYFSVSVNVDMLRQRDLSLCSQQRKAWWPWRFHVWVCEDLKCNRWSTNYTSYHGSRSQTKAAKRESKEEREKGNWKMCEGQREREGGRHLGIKTEEGFRVWELGQGLCNKKGEENSKTWERREKNIELLDGNHRKRVWEVWLGATIKKANKKMELFRFKLLWYCVNYIANLNFAEFILQKLLGIYFCCHYIIHTKGKKQMAHKEVKEE